MDTHRHTYSREIFTVVQFQLLPWPRGNASRVGCVLRKCRDVRPMNRIRFSLLFDFSPLPNARIGWKIYPLYGEREREREREEFSFRDTEFIFPEEIREGILRHAFRELPSLRSMLLELYPDTIYHGKVGKKTGGVLRERVIL